MNKDEEIKILVTRFMDGETTLDEERELYRYFSGNGVSDNLLPIREYFCSIASMATLERRGLKKLSGFLSLFSRPLFIGISASIAFLVVVGVEVCCGI